MRQALWTLAVLAVAALALLVLLPVLSLLFVALAGVLLLAAGAVLAAPLLARLPWFRHWISVEEYGGRRMIRFGRTRFAWDQRPNGRREDPDVIDVEGREIPDRET